MNINQKEYNNMFEKIKDEGLWSYDWEIHDFMKRIGFVIRTYSQEEILNGVMDEIIAWNNEDLSE